MHQFCPESQDTWCNCSHFPWRTKAGLVVFVEGCALHTSRTFVKLIWSMPYPKREQVPSGGDGSRLPWRKAGLGWFFVEDKALHTSPEAAQGKHLSSAGGGWEGGSGLHLPHLPPEGRVRV